jgi:hypothetical protein
MILKRLMELPPRESARKIKQRLLGKQGEFDVAQIINSSRLMRSQRFYDFLSRYEAILARANGWKNLDFEDRNVLEIGCGQMLGFGPIAIFRGAKSFSGIEPLFDARVLCEPEIVNTYYLSIFKDLSAIYGARFGFDEFMTRLRDRTDVRAEYLVDLKLPGPFEVVISNSCLEHIFDFEASMAALYKKCTADCRFLHLMDFGNHLPTRNPFDGLYSADRESFWARHGRKINLLRLPEVIGAIDKAGFRVGKVPYSHYGDTYDGPIHEYWRNRYPDDDVLFLKTAIFHSLD